MVQLLAVLRKAGGADGDLDAHLDGRRRFAGLAGRENPFPGKAFTARDSWDTRKDIHLTIQALMADYIYCRSQLRDQCGLLIIKKRH